MDNSVYSAAMKMIGKLESEKGSSSGKAVLARLRASIGTDFGQADQVWPFVFENMPSEYLSDTGKVTAEEAVIFTTLQLYALCQQGSKDKVSNDFELRSSIGRALAIGRKAKEDNTAIDRRFNTLITSTTYEELTYHLRQLLKLVVSRSKIVINFAGLAQDLYWIYRNHIRETCLRWARDYYKAPDSDTETEKN